ncbi:MAG: hypothetical protein V4438_04225 [Patescibacteria group bacterium]
MKKYLKIVAVMGSIFITALLLVGLTSKSASANPSFFVPYAYITGLTAATGTPAYLTPGTATTTLVYDTNNSGSTYKTNSATLLLELVGSTTGTILKTDLEYSQDGIDYYQDGGVGPEVFSTTTRPVDISYVNSFSLTFASSTAGLAAVSATQATTTRAMNIKTPTRFVRAVFSLPIGSKNGAVWAQLVPNKEKSE